MKFLTNTEEINETSQWIKKNFYYNALGVICFESAYETYKKETAYKEQVPDSKKLFSMRLRSFFVNDVKKNKVKFLNRKGLKLYGLGSENGGISCMSM